MDSTELFGGDSDLSEVEDEPQEDAVREEEEEDALEDAAADPIEEDDEDDDEWVAPEKKKRERSDSVDAAPAAAKRKRKGRKAKLESFAALPLDLLEDICSHLDLETIYYISLVNKQLNAFLATSKSKPLWIAARETSGLPELKAEGFNELQYAQLMFGLGCSFCGAAKDRTHKVDYSLRMRACPDCVEANFVPYVYLYSNFNRLDGIQGILRATTLKLGGYNQAVYALSELQYWDQAIEDALEDDTSFSASYTWARTVRPGYDDARETDAMAITDWLVNQAEAAKRVKADLRERRKQAIQNRFVKLGWSSSHFETARWESHSLFNSTAELTDRLWNSARPKLEIVLNEQKAAIDLHDEAQAREMRRSDVETLYKEITNDPEASSTAGLLPLPAFSEFLELQSVKALWDPSDADADVASLPYDAIAAELVVLKEALAKELFPLVLFHLFEAGTTGGSHLPTPDDDGAYTSDQMDDVFSLVTSIFRCSGCYGHIDSFPSILSHQCIYQQKASFKPGVYTVHDGYLEHCRKLLEITSLEGATTTWADVESLGNRFSCVSCKPSLGTCCRTWKQMTRHMFKSVQNDTTYCRLVYHESDKEVQAKFLEISTNWTGYY